MISLYTAGTAFVMMTMAGIAGFLAMEYLSLKKNFLVQSDTFNPLRNVLASLIALSLSFMLNTAKVKYDAQIDEINTQAAKAIDLDRILVFYGSDTQAARSFIFQAIKDELFEINRAAAHDANDISEALRSYKEERLREEILKLNPKTPNQAWTKQLALEQAQKFTHLRWKIYQELAGHMEWQIIVFLLVSLTVVFYSLGVTLPNHWASLVGLTITAGCFSAAIFLLIEFERPFNGMMNVDIEPLEKVQVLLRQN